MNENFINKITLGDCLEYIPMLTDNSMKALEHHVLSTDHSHGDDTLAPMFDPGHGKAGDGLMQEEGTFQSLRSQTRDYQH